MCPDREILSTYFDGEVPSPWREKIAAHVAECPDCGRVLESYGELRTALRDDSRAATAAAAPDLFKSRLRASLAAGRRVPLWKRRVRFSFAAAAAAAAFVAGGSLGLTLLAGTARSDASRVATEKVKPLDVTVKVKDVKQLLEILNNQKTIREVTIQLPEAKQFEIRGEPTFLKAAEYSGGSRR